VHRRPYQPQPQQYRPSRPEYEQPQQQQQQHRPVSPYQNRRPASAEYNNNNNNEQPRRQQHERPMAPHRYPVRPSRPYQKPNYSTNEDQYAMSSKNTRPIYESNVYEPSAVVYRPTTTTTAKPVYSKPVSTTTNAYEPATRVYGNESEGRME
jgi:hypothetical protein